MELSPFDDRGRYIFEDFSQRWPFASFLPGVAGLLGVPMWVFYTNRGQAIAGFGVGSKDCPVMEYQPANKAYQSAPLTGFRTFIKLQGRFYEPFGAIQFSPLSPRQQRMLIGLNEVEIEESCQELRTNVLYYTLPGENFAALVRQVTFTNLSEAELQIEVLDGLAQLIPYGVNNGLLKGMGRTLEAWMVVDNAKQGAPFYRVRASVGDRPEVEDVQAGNFALAFSQGTNLPVIVDPDLIFGADTTLQTPLGFLQCSLAEILNKEQAATGKTPCGIFGSELRIPPGQSACLYAVFGHVSSLEVIEKQRAWLAQPEILAAKRLESARLTGELTEPIATQTSSPLFDAYCQQSFLDNLLRGGWPLLPGNPRNPKVFHVYSRKHGDLERDYNHYILSPEYYSQGNGAYRDVNQNRRCDVLFKPQVGDFNLVSFINLIQADGYNPLAILGSRFRLEPAVLSEFKSQTTELVEHFEALLPVLEKPFTPGRLVHCAREAGLKIPPGEFLDRVLTLAEQDFEADFGEGYWIDHWTYNLDLLDSFLAVFPDRKTAQLFDEEKYSFYDSDAVVQPRLQKTVLSAGKPRRFGSIIHDYQKTALISRRLQSPHTARVKHGLGEPLYTTLFVKLLCLALVKCASLDPGGMGIEMEADKPGWYDALNGLPGLFGSGISETCELARLLEFLIEALHDQPDRSVTLPLEADCLFAELVRQVEAYNLSASPKRDFHFWDAASTARESFRSQTRLGFDGQRCSIGSQELCAGMQLLLGKVREGLIQAEQAGNGLMPSYFFYEVTEYELLCDEFGDPQVDGKGRPRVRPLRFAPQALPPFLEGPVHALKLVKDPQAAREIYTRVRASELFDRKLGMYRLNTSLESLPQEIGRARAFPPGWLENASIWLHMEYKYLLEVLRAGLYPEFFDDFRNMLVPFLDPIIYGRSPLENVSFIASSAHSDQRLHGAGFVARLSGSTAEMLSLWFEMMAGRYPFQWQAGQLSLALEPVLPGWLFTEEGLLSFRFLDRCTITYHNPSRLDLYPGCPLKLQHLLLTLSGGKKKEIPGAVIPAPYAEMVRDGKVGEIEAEFSIEAVV